MIRLKLFTQPLCPNCPPAKELVDGLQAENKRGLVIERYDVNTLDGLTEATLYTVQSTPTILLTRESGEEIKGWRGETPSKEVVLAAIG